MRLADIDPAALAQATVAEVFDRAGRILSSLDVGRYVVAESGAYGALSPAKADGSGWQRSVVGHAVYCLTRYAQTGEAMDADVHEYLVSLIPAEDPGLDDLEPDATTELGLVCQAALARERIEACFSIGTTWLAALAGLTRGRIQQLVTSGEIASTLDASGDTVIPAVDARRWLGSRGVPGFRGERK